MRASNGSIKREIVYQRKNFLFDKAVPRAGVVKGKASNGSIEEKIVYKRKDAFSLRKEKVAEGSIEKDRIYNGKKKKAFL